jgi:tetratricopeptide (TPR) repeat protein
MNRAFSHSTGQDVEIAYYAASQMVAFTAEQWGFGAITRALELWGQGKRTPEVIREAFGVTADQYDARYRTWEGARLARFAGQYVEARSVGLDEARAKVSASPSSASAHAALGRELIHAHQQGEAAREVDEALRLDPNSADAHFAAATLAATANDAPRATTHLRAIVAAGGDGYVLEMHLAEVARAGHDKAGERRALEAAHRFDPTQVDAVHALYRIAADEKREGDALSLLREWTRLDQHDRDGEWKELLRRLVDAKAWGEAKEVGQAALYVDVESGDVHVAYAKACAATGDHETAAFELDSALLCDGSPHDKATAHALLARELQALHDVPGARSHREEALRLDPNNADAKALSP